MSTRKTQRIIYETNKCFGRVLWKTRRRSRGKKLGRSEEDGQDREVDFPLLMAEVMEFYGMSFEELINLTVSWFCKLFSRIPQIEARRQISWLPVYAMAHMEKAAGQRTLRDMQKKARGIQPTKLPNDADESSINHGWFRLREQGIHASDK